MRTRPAETVIKGSWTIEGGKVVADANCLRIEQLTKSHLVFVKADPSGWATLYRDPLDGTYWEHIYPQSEMHGGGPPELRKLSVADAEKKYGNWLASEINK